MKKVKLVGFVFRLVMRSTVCVAVQFVNNRFRSRLCIRNLALVVVLTITIFYTLIGHSYHHGKYVTASVQPNVELKGSTRNLAQEIKLNLIESKGGTGRRVESWNKFSDPHGRDNNYSTHDNGAPLKHYVTTTKPDVEPSTLETETLIVHQIVNVSHPLNYLDQLPIKGVLPRVLLIFDNFSVDSAKKIKVLLQSQRIDFDSFSSSKNRIPPPLSKLNSETDEVIGRYVLILCADIGLLLLRLTQVERRLFLDYSRAFNVSIIAVKRTAFDHLRGYTETKFTFGKYLISPVGSRFMEHIEVDARRQWLFAKGGVRVTNFPRSAHWQVFLNQPTRSPDGDHMMHPDNSVRGYKDKEIMPNHLSLQFLKEGRVSESTVDKLLNLKYKLNNSQTNYTTYQTSPLALIDRDLVPGAISILIGMDIRFWLTKLILLDMIEAYSKHRLLRFRNERWVMVDIDDIFVAPKGLKMTPHDVEVQMYTNVCVCVTL